MLNTTWLKSFAALAELGNFTRVAERLGLTQAAVSQHMRHLEDELGPLLIRRPRRVELTPAGRALRDYCVEVDLADRQLRRRLQDTDDMVGEFSIITPGSVGLSIYPLLLDMQQRHRGLVVRHRFAPEPEVLAAVLDHRFELGLVTQKPDDVRLTASLFSHEPLELVVPADETVGDWEDLKRLGFIDHPDGVAMATRLLARRFPGNPGMRDLAVRGFSNQIGLILEPVARGLGFTVVPQYARRAFTRPEAIRVVEQEVPLVDTLWLVHRAEWAVSKRAARVVERLVGRLGA